jgi:hypothetical protein
VSNNNGGSWVNLETVNASTGGWVSVSRPLADVLPLTSQMKVRFIVADGTPDSNVEAALDAISLSVVACYCPADFNEDGFVNGDDADSFYAAFDLGDPSADFDGNGFVNGDDADGFAAAFAAGC